MQLGKLAAGVVVVGAVLAGTAGAITIWNVIKAVRAKK